MKLNMGKRELEVGGKYLNILRDSTDIKGDFAALRARIKEDGYLRIRGLHSREKVTATRKVILENLAANGAKTTLENSRERSPRIGPASYRVKGALGVMHAEALSGRWRCAQKRQDVAKSAMVELKHSKRNGLATPRSVRRDCGRGPLIRFR